MTNMPRTGVPRHREPGAPGADVTTVSSLRRVLALVRLGGHVLAGVLLAAGVTRALADGSGILPVVAAGGLVGSWYAAGVVAAAKSRRRGLAVMWLAGLVAVWVFAVWISPEFVWFAFVIWLLAVPLWGGWPALGLSAAVFAVVVFAPVWHHGATSFANVVGPLIGGAFALGISRGYLMLIHDAAERERLVVSLTRAQREMADLHEELALAGRQSGAASERTRLAREIHDTVAQSLSSIRLLTHAAGTSETGAATRGPVRTGPLLGQIDDLAADALADVRRIVAALIPSELENAALAAALQRLLDRLADETGIVTRLHVDDTVRSLPTVTEVALLRTAQSGLANVRVHARATSVVVNLIDAGSTVRLDIVDDGRGFDLEKWQSSYEDTGAESSFGLRFMRSRLRELGGGLDIESAPGEGTALSAFAPMSTVVGKR